MQYITIFGHLLLLYKHQGTVSVVNGYTIYILQVKHKFIMTKILIREIEFINVNCI